METKLEEYLKNSFKIKNKSSSQVYGKDQKEIVKVRDISLYFEANEIEPGSFDKQYREIRVHFPLGMIVNQN